jgi:hypothetical protein
MRQGENVGTVVKRAVPTHRSRKPGLTWGPTERQCRAVRRCGAMRHCAAARHPSSCRGVPSSPKGHLLDGGRQASVAGEAALAISGAGRGPWGWPLLRPLKLATAAVVAPKAAAIVAAEAPAVVKAAGVAAPVVDLRTGRGGFVGQNCWRPQHCRGSAQRRRGGAVRASLPSPGGGRPWLTAAPAAGFSSTRGDGRVPPPGRRRPRHCQRHQARRRHRSRGRRRRRLRRRQSRRRCCRRRGHPCGAASTAKGRGVVQGACWAVARNWRVRHPTAPAARGAAFVPRSRRPHAPALLSRTPQAARTRCPCQGRRRRLRRCPPNPGGRRRRSLGSFRRPDGRGRRPPPSRGRRCRPCGGRGRSPKAAVRVSRRSRKRGVQRKGRGQHGCQAHCRLSCA